MLLNLGENNFETIDFAHFFFLKFFSCLLPHSKPKTDRTLKLKCYSIWVKIILKPSILHTFFIFVIVFFFKKIQKIEKVKVNKNIEKVKMSLNLGENDFETIDFAHFFIFLNFFSCLLPHSKPKTDRTLNLCNKIISIKLF